MYLTSGLCLPPAGSDASVQVCQYDTTDSANYFQVQVLNAVSAGMRSAVIIMSIAGPAFALGYVIYDQYLYKRK